MKRNTITGLIAGFGLIGLVLFKNIYRLDKRIQEDRAELINFENDLITILFLKNLVRENDTTYLESGELFNTVEGVAGSLSNDGFNRKYSISVARYSKDFTAQEAFHLDSLKKNLNQRFVNSQLQLLGVRNIEIQGIRGLKYIGRNGQDFEQSVIFTLDNNVISINTKGKDSVDVVFEKIIKSVKLKTPYNK